MVVINPRLIDEFVIATLAAGARPLVVQEAFDMTWCLAGSYLSSLTPSTTVRSSPSAGDEMITFLAPPLVMWFSAPLTVFTFLIDAIFLYSEKPVPSMTISTPRSPQGILAGSVSLKAFTGLPSISIRLRPLSTVPVEATVVRVVFEQVSHGGQITDVVESHYFQLIRMMFPDCLDHLPANAAKPVNATFTVIVILHFLILIWNWFILDDDNH